MGAKVVGLAFDIFGGMSAGSRHLLGRLCMLSQQAVMSISPSEFASRLYGSIAIALARRVGALIQQQQGATLQERATTRMGLARTGRGGRMGEGEEGEEGVELARDGECN